MSDGESIKQFIDGAWVDGEAEEIVVADKYTGTTLATFRAASGEQLDRAVAAARKGFENRHLDRYTLSRVLQKTADLLMAARDELAGTITAESGIPWKDSWNEVARAAETFRLSAEEGRSLVGAMVPIEGAEGQSGRRAFTIRVPRGVVGGISSFNSPLNMAAHKIAPALAAGNAVVFKPPSATPLSAAKLVALLLKAGLPPELLQLVLGSRAIGQKLVEHAGIDFLTFTGSTAVGREIRRVRGLRPIALELGSIAATMVLRDADLDRAALRCAQSGFRRQGQMCTSTQRLFVERAVLAPFQEKLLGAVRGLVVGDPRDRATDVGPMISEREAKRAEESVREALDRGAVLLAGGKREGTVLHPTVLADVPAGARALREEIFAPVLSLIPFDDLEDAIADVNDTPFGLAAGVFTRDLPLAMHLAEQLHVGVVHLNNASSSRVDLMPFAGVKDSGVGVEGPRYAIREMTEERLITMTL